MATSPPEDAPNEATPDGEEGGREPAPTSGDSPVFKKRTKRRKRVIFDSDDEAEEKEGDGEAEGKEGDGGAEGKEGDGSVNGVGTLDDVSHGGGVEGGKVESKGEEKLAVDRDEEMAQSGTENGDKTTDNGRVELEKMTTSGRTWTYIHYIAL